MSVHGQRQQQNPVNYEYVYYDYYDDYYDYGGPAAQAPQPTAVRHQQPSRARAPSAPETQQQKPVASPDVDLEAVGDLPEYDLKEIVDAWKEYVKEKEKKQKVNFAGKSQIYFYWSCLGS